MPKLSNFTGSCFLSLVNEIHEDFHEKVSRKWFHGDDPSALTTQDERYQCYVSFWMGVVYAHYQSGHITNKERELLEDVILARGEIEEIDI